MVASLSRLRSVHDVVELDRVAGRRLAKIGRRFDSAGVVSDHFKVPIIDLDLRALRPAAAELFGYGESDPLRGGIIGQLFAFGLGRLVIAGKVVVGHSSEIKKQPRLVCLEAKTGAQRFRNGSLAATGRLRGEAANRTPDGMQCHLPDAPEPRSYVCG
jgi:hypothetical protein